MPKLPKAMQDRQRNIKQLRTQGSMPAGGAEGKVNRKMRRQMAQQGIEGMEEINAKKVIIQTDKGNLVIDAPQVIKLKQGGMEVYQVIGKGQEGAAEGDADVTVETEGMEGDMVEGEIISSESETEDQGPVTLNVQITEQDIQLVMMQTGASHEAAENALKDAGGDLARAIISLKTR